MTTKETIVKGKAAQIDSLLIGQKEVLISGTALRTARLADEWYDDIEDPAAFVQALTHTTPRADIFTFWQRLPDTTPHHSSYLTEWESIAALPVSSSEHWRKAQLNPKSRNLLKKADKFGVVVRQTAFDDDFVDGITNIFNETPVRQGKPFWHYGKTAATVKREFSRYLFREDVFGAYCDNELVGFIFLAYAGRYALLGQILSKVSARDKAPNNALIAKAVDVCAGKGIPYLVYAMWTDGSLGHFKRQNGFQRFDLPRYYVPLTLKGRVALTLGLHHGLRGLLPSRLRTYFVSLRQRWYSERSKVTPSGT